MRPDRDHACVGYGNTWVLIVVAMSVSIKDHTVVGLAEQALNSTNCILVIWDTRKLRKLQYKTGGQIPTTLDIGTHWNAVVDGSDSM